jgi:hypothetical protein
MLGGIGVQWSAFASDRCDSHRLAACGRFWQGGGAAASSSSQSGVWSALAAGEPHRCPRGELPDWHVKHFAGDPHDEFELSADDTLRHAHHDKR